MKHPDLTALTGKIAVTDSDLSPKGTAIIDDEVYEVEAEEGYVEAGRGVKVTRVKGRKIFIRRV